MNTPKLKKSNDKIIAGVCAGIAEYMGWNKTLVRVLFILLGVSIVAYLVLILVMPAADSDPPSSFNINDFRRN